MTNTRVARWIFAFLSTGILLAACAGQQEPAKETIDSTEKSIAALRDEASKYAPDELKDLEASLAVMKANYDKGNYSAVLSAGREIHTRIQTVMASLQTKKGEADQLTQQLTEQWNSLSEEVPSMVESVQARVEMMAKPGKMPKNLDPAAFEHVKADAKAMSDRWQSALGAFANSNLQEAVDMAQAAKEKATTIMAELDAVTKS
jgi:hypothetical protein